MFEFAVGSIIDGVLNCRYAINKEWSIVMQSHWSKSPYGTFILQQEVKLLRQALIVSAANSVALVCDTEVWAAITAEPLGINQAKVFAAKFADAHLCDCANEQNKETDSVDWLIIWHGLEQQEDPRALLREATRVLSEGGRLSIFGFNPLRSLSRNLWFWKDRSQSNIQATLQQFRLHDWLRLLNYEVTQVNTLIAPNLSRLERHQRKCSEMQHVNTFPLVGLIYHFEALRRHFPMTSLRVPIGKEKKRALQLVSPAGSGRVAKLLPAKNRVIKSRVFRDELNSPPKLTGLKSSNKPDNHDNQGQ